MDLKSKSQRTQAQQWMRMIQKVKKLGNNWKHIQLHT